MGGFFGVNLTLIFGVAQIFNENVTSGLPTSAVSISWECEILSTWCNIGRQFPDYEDEKRLEAIRVDSNTFGQQLKKDRSLILVCRNFCHFRFLCSTTHRLTGTSKELSQSLKENSLSIFQ